MMFSWLLLWLFLASPQANSPVIAKISTSSGIVAITEERLIAYAKVRPQLSARQLLDELIAFEILASEAEQRDLRQEAMVQESVKSVMVHQYLEQIFERTWSVETIPEHYLRQAYEKNIGFFKHPELREADHILITTAESKRPTDLVKDAQARALAQKIREALITAPSREAFLATGQGFKAETEALGLVLKAEAVGRFSMEGPLVKAFASECFKLNVGGVSEVFATDFGWHVARLAAIEPPLDRPFEQVKAELRERITPEVRVMEFKKLTDQLGAKFGALVNYEPLEALAKKRGLESEDQLKETKRP